MKIKSYLTSADVERLNSYSSIREMRAWFLTKVGVKEWFSEQSFLQYLKAVQSFSSFAGYENPDVLVRALKQNPEEGTRQINSWIKQFSVQGWAPATQNGFAARLKRFLVINEAEINWKHITLPRKRGIVQDKAPDKQEMRSMLMYAPLWLKATILVLATSGLRVGSLCSLNLKHANLDYDPQGQIALIQVPPEFTKAKVGYYTFIGPEAVDLLKKHLNAREKKGQKLTEDSPLIKPTKGARLTYDGVNLSYNRMLNRAGLTKKSGEYYILHLHSLRKFFRSNLEGILTKSQVERLMGHVSTEYLDGSYFRPPEENMRESYRHALPNLTILEDVQSEEFQKKQLLTAASLILSEEKIARLKEILS